MSAKERPFYYVSDDHRLYAERQAGSSEFELIYAGDVLACDWNFDTSVVALLCPGDAHTGQHFTTDAEKSMIRLFKVVNGEIADLIDEVETGVATCVLWIGSHYVISGNPEGVTSVFELKANRLKLSVQDAGAYPFRVAHGLGIVNREAQQVTIWDLQKNKAVAKEALPNRRAKKGKTRAVHNTCSSGSFSFVMNDDATFHAAYGTGQGFKLLRPMVSIFSPDTRRPKTCESSSPLVHALVPCALSASEVLVAAPGLPDVYRMRYEKSEQTLAVVDKARLDDHDTIVALKKDKCLVKRCQSEATVYVVVPLEFHLLSERKKAQSTSTQEAAALPTTASPAPAEPTRRERDASSPQNAGATGDVRADAAPSSPPSDGRAVACRVAIGCAFIAAVAVAVIRIVSKGR